MANYPATKITNAGVEVVLLERPRSANPGRPVHFPSVYYAPSPDEAKLPFWYPHVHGEIYICTTPEAAERVAEAITTFEKQETATYVMYTPSSGMTTMDPKYYWGSQLIGFSYSDPEDDECSLDTDNLLTEPVHIYAIDPECKAQPAASAYQGVRIIATADDPDGSRHVALIQGDGSSVLPGGTVDCGAEGHKEAAVRKMCMDLSLDPNRNYWVMGVVGVQAQSDWMGRGELGTYESKARINLVYWIHVPRVPGYKLPVIGACPSEGAIDVMWAPLKEVINPEITYLTVDRESYIYTYEDDPLANDPFIARVPLGEMGLLEGIPDRVEMQNLAAEGRCGDYIRDAIPEWEGQEPTPLITHTLI